MTETRRYLSHGEVSYIGPKGNSSKKAMLDSLDLILRTTPWRMVRVTDIAEESGCSPALFYNYFPTLESAFEELWERMSHQGGRKFEHAVQIRALLDCELTLKGR